MGPGGSGRAALLCSGLASGGAGLQVGQGFTCPPLPYKGALPLGPLSRFSLLSHPSSHIGCFRSYYCLLFTFIVTVLGNLNIGMDPFGWGDSACRLASCISGDSLKAVLGWREFSTMPSLGAVSVALTTKWQGNSAVASAHMAPGVCHSSVAPPAGKVKCVVKSGGRQVA